MLKNIELFNIVNDLLRKDINVMTYNNGFLINIAIELTKDDGEDYYKHDEIEVYDHKFETCKYARCKSICNEQWDIIFKDILANYLEISSISNIYYEDKLVYNCEFIDHLLATTEINKSTQIMLPAFSRLSKKLNLYTFIEDDTYPLGDMDVINRPFRFPYTYTVIEIIGKIAGKKDNDKFFGNYIYLPNFDKIYDFIIDILAPDIVRGINIIIRSTMKKSESDNSWEFVDDFTTDI